MTKEEAAKSADLVYEERLTLSAMKIYLHRSIRSVAQYITVNQSNISRQIWYICEIGLKLGGGELNLTQIWLNFTGYYGYLIRACQYDL